MKLLLHGHGRLLIGIIFPHILWHWRLIYADGSLLHTRKISAARATSRVRSQTRTTQ